MVEKRGEVVDLEQTRAVGKMGEVHTTLPLGVVPGAARVVSPGMERDCGEPLARSHGMDGIRELLSAVRDAGLAAGNFRGLLHIAIGRTITRPDGKLVTVGVTWRELAAELKFLKFDPQLVRELGADPEALAIRDRERFWYSAIALARVDSREAVQEADRLVPKLKTLGYLVGPAPSGSSSLGAQKPEPKPHSSEPSTKPSKKRH